jgi:hypothetical protein
MKVLPHHDNYQIPTSLRLPVLKIGMRKKSFHLNEKVPAESDKLKMCKRGDYNPSAQSLTKEVFHLQRSCCLHNERDDTEMTLPEMTLNEI